jgi:hypothetical protein
MPINKQQVLDPLGMVAVDSPAEGDVLGYEGAAALWRNRAPTLGDTDGQIWVRGTRGSDTYRGDHLKDALARAQLLTPGGAALSATNRATLIIPQARYLLSKGAATRAAGITLGDFVDVRGIGMPVIYSYGVDGSSARNGPTCRQTGYDVRISGVRFEAYSTPYPITDQCCRSFEFGSLADGYGLITSGTGATVLWTDMETYWECNVTKTGAFDDAIVQVGDWILLSGGSITRPRAYRIGYIAGSHNYVRLEAGDGVGYEDVGWQNLSHLAMPEDSSANVPASVFRCLFQRDAGRDLEEDSCAMPGADQRLQQSLPRAEMVPSHGELGGCSGR